ncbi:MAG: cupredoxin domain-containing protein [bacterium]|nr:cupredoxin domain-containing protein [bacterium]
MRERYWVVWGSVFVAVLVAGILVAFVWNDVLLPPPGVVPAPPPAGGPGAPTATSAPATFSPTVPDGAVLTEAANEAPAAPGVEEKFKTINLEVTERGYDPITLTVRMGDITQIRFSALDGDYDLSIPYSGLYQYVRRGETKNVTFQATTVGSFQFFCRDHCPSGGRIESLLVVLPK